MLGSGLRIGELVSLRWRTRRLERRRVRIVEFASALGYEVAASSGKSRDAVRSLELDDGLVCVLRPSADAGRGTPRVAGVRR